MGPTIEVAERGRRIAFSFDDLMQYHGPHSPGGVVMAHPSDQVYDVVAVRR